MGKEVATLIMYGICAKKYQSREQSNRFLKQEWTSLKESDNVRSFLTLKGHIPCQKQNASLGDPSAELKLVSVSVCVGNTLDRG